MAWKSTGVQRCLAHENPCFTVVICGTSHNARRIYEAFEAEYGRYAVFGTDFAEVLKNSEHLTPVVLVVEQGMLRNVNPTSVRARTSADVSIKPILLAREVKPAKAERLLRMGFCGFISHDAPFETVREAVESVAAGDVWADRRVVANALHGLRSLVELLMDEKFTRREVDILRRIAAGYDNRRIAEELFIARDTVRWHLRSLYAKLGLHDRQIAAGLFALDDPGDIV
ncbi:MAG: response regulator transcription factor [Bryobacteraceae bacterium]